MNQSLNNINSQQNHFFQPEISLLNVLHKNGLLQHCLKSLHDYSSTEATIVVLNVDSYEIMILSLPIEMVSQLLLMKI